MPTPERLLNKRIMKLLLTSVVLCALILSGCLQIKQQSITAKFDKNSYTLKLLFIYEGLYVKAQGEKAAESDLGKAKEQLATFIGSQSEFSLFFGGLGDFSIQPTATDKEDVLAIKKKLAPLIDIHNDAFLLNGENELSLRQSITIQDYVKFAKVLNEVISTAIDAKVTEQLSKPRDAQANDPISDDSYRRIQRAARLGYEWIKISYGKIDISFPISATDSKQIVEKFESDKSDKEMIQAVRAVTKSFRITYGENALVFSFGDGQNPIIDFQGQRNAVADPAYEGDLFTYARTLRLPFDRSQDTIAAKKSFSESH